MVNSPAALVGPKEVKQQLAHWNEDRGALVISITSIFFAIAFIAVVLRLAAKWKQRLRSQWDDYLIVTALVSPLKSPYKARLIPSRFWMLVFWQTHYLAGPMYDLDVLALIFWVEVRFGSGIHSLKAGVPVIVKNLQVEYSYIHSWNPQFAEFSHQGAFCVSTDICPCPYNDQDVHTSSL